MSGTSKRVSLATLGARAATPIVTAPVETDEATSGRRQPTGFPQPPAAAAAPREKPANRRPRFDDYERKETRLAAAQLADLTARARQLNRARDRKGERITENTLIRIAVDLLLSRPDLAGATEAELRKSVGL